MRTEHGWGFSEEEVGATLKTKVMQGNWCGTHWDIFLDLKSRFGDDDVKAEIGDIKSLHKEVYDIIESKLGPKETTIWIMIWVYHITIKDRKPPNGRRSLENICRDVVKRRAPEEAKALIKGNYHTQIASGVIIDD